MRIVGIEILDVVSDLIKNLIIFFYKFGIICNFFKF